MFEKHLKKIEPYMVMNTLGGITSSSSLSTTPSGSQYDLSNSSSQQQSNTASGVAGGNRFNRKRSKSKSTAGDYRLRLTADQKSEIAMKEIEELKDETRKARDDAEKSIDSYKAILEEANVRMNEIKTGKKEFERDIGRGAVNSLTKRIITEKLIKHFEDKLKDKDTLIDKYRLKNASLKKKKFKLQNELREKEELGEVLHEVDFKQLKIENKQYIQKIDEKSAEMIKLKKLVGTVTQTLNLLKKQLNSNSKQNDSMLIEIRTRATILNKLKNEMELVEKEHLRENAKNKRLRSQLENFNVPEVNDYVNAEESVYALEKEVKVWQRKVEIAEVNKI
jgi:chromosome segregation ATPase